MIDLKKFKQTIIESYLISNRDDFLWDFHVQKTIPYPHYSNTLDHSKIFSYLTEDETEIVRSLSDEAQNGLAKKLFKLIENTVDEIDREIWEEREIIRTRGSLSY